MPHHFTPVKPKCASWCKELFKKNHCDHEGCFACTFCGGAGEGGSDMRSEATTSDAMPAPSQVLEALALAVGELRWPGDACAPSGYTGPTCFQIRSWEPDAAILSEGCAQLTSALKQTVPLSDGIVVGFDALGPPQPPFSPPSPSTPPALPPQPAQPPRPPNPPPPPSHPPPPSPSPSPPLLPLEGFLSATTCHRLLSDPNQLFRKSEPLSFDPRALANVVGPLR